MGHVRRPSQLYAFRNAMKTGTVSERGRPPERPERVSKRDENGAEFVAAHPPGPRGALQRNWPIECGVAMAVSPSTPPRAIPAPAWSKPRRVTLALFFFIGPSRCGLVSPTVPYRGGICQDLTRTGHCFVASFLPLQNGLRGALSASPPTDGSPHTSTRFETP